MKDYLYDPCTFSNPEFYTINHVKIVWDVDFDLKILKGSVNLKFELNSDLRLPTQENLIVLDTRDLIIRSIHEQNTKTKLGFEFGNSHKDFGTPLKINLSSLEDLSNLKNLDIFIEYETSPNASALQWLDANTTLGKRHPYLFSQCQAIHARSILPCQDTPAVKFTYDATVTVSKPLVVLMSAISLDNKEVEGNRIQYNFRQKIRIPSYLLAIVAADLTSKDIGPISRVWTEREMIDKAAYEFEEVDKLLKDAESLLGEYVWERYDLLVLPPSFPYGGMENPCLTFVTPTIIAGDRSLVTVIQHEIAHSWTGNLVTNSSWEHFWLNEGFTRFIENKLIGLFNNDEKCRHFECIDGWRDLIEAVEVFANQDKIELSQMVPNLKDVDPDEAFSSIPYEKGQMLLFYLEQKLGGVEVFNQYLRAHIEKFKGKSINTDQWLEFLSDYFKDKKEILDSVDWQHWLYKPGMPPVELEFDRTIANRVITVSNELATGEIVGLDLTFTTFNSNQKRELLSQLLDKDPLSIERIELINKYYKFGETQNSEILFRWIRLCIKAKWKPIIQLAIKFVTDQGRMKFTRPVYRDLYAWDQSRELAIENYRNQCQFMHQTTSGLVAKDLHLV